MDRSEIFQNKGTISIPRENFRDKIVMSDELKRNDYRVLNLLLTVLDGWNYEIRENSKVVDPLNFHTLEVDVIADTLNMKKKDVKDALRHLEDQLIIERGSSSSVSKGYRFMF